MKNILLFILICLPFVSLAQELKINPDSHFYEFSTINEVNQNGLVGATKNRLNTLNYKNITIEDSLIAGQGLITHMVGGFAPVEITYVAKYELKANKYRLTLTGFVLKDKSNAATPLENAGVVKNKWVKIINSKLPEIVSQLQKLEDQKKW